MSVMTSIPTPELARRGAEETAKFLRRADHDPQVCLELLRRALAEQSDEAFTHVYRIYEPLVTRWVYRHSRFALTGESVEYFTSAAFRAFYVALHGAKFARFQTVAAILHYLQSCVHTEIAQYLRQYGYDLSAPLEEAPERGEEADPGARLEASELWAHICRLLPDERDQLLAHCALVLDLAPRQICVAHPSWWTSERAVSVALYQIRRRLRADPELTALADHAALDKRGAGRDAQIS